jgi:hypothetical protein
MYLLIDVADDDGDIVVVAVDDDVDCVVDV